jgi:hypothetical protein
MKLGILTKYVPKTSIEITREMLDVALESSKGKVEKNQFLTLMSAVRRIKKETVAQHLRYIFRENDYNTQKHNSEIYIARTD